jgi:Protein of unknown function (DUF4232)
MRAGLRTLVIGALAVTASGLSPLVPAAHARAAAAAPTCQATQLAITQAASSGAAGHIAIALRLHNISMRSCTLKGFATIVLLDGARRPLLTVLRWGTGGFFNPFNRPVRLVTLAPGGNAYMAMGWSHIPAPGQTCPLAPNLLLLPPPASSALLVAVGHGSVPAFGPVDACGGQLTVSAVEPTPFLL